jgi:iron complex outermembrane receptor protein
MSLSAFGDAPDTDPANGLLTIIISPEWRDIDLQRTPSTVNVLTGPQLDTADVNNTQQLQYRVPGMVFRANSGIGEPYLRGIGGTIPASGNSGVSTFIDGVYQTRASQALQELYDIERVEVIKGPHGVHLGRNVVGGAISILTRDPVPYREACTDVLYGTENQRLLRGTYNQHISDTGVSFRLSGTLNDRDGYTRNVYLDKDLDNRDYYALRGKLRYRPSGRLDMVFSAAHSREDDTSNLISQPDPGTGVNGGILLGGIVPDNPRKVTDNVDESQDIGNGLYSARISWHSDKLDARSLTAWQETDLNNAIDLDGTNVDFSSNFPTSDSHAISQEFRLGSPRDQRLSWVAGVFYLHEDASQALDARLPLAGIRNNPDSDTRNTSYAAFGELGYAITPAWQGSAGLRYSYDASRLDLEQTITDPGGITRFTSKQEDHWDALTPELDIRYTPDPDTLYYAGIARGYKAGGYNAFAIQPAYDPEFLLAYEAGIKVTYPRRQLRVNSALFYYDYEDMQLQTLPPDAPPGTLPIITNAGRASVRGLDLQAWYQPLWNLELTAGLTLLDARFDSFESVDPNNPATDPDRAGDPLPNAPDVSLLLGGGYRWLVPHYGEIKLSLDYRYQSAVYYNPYKDAAVRQDAYRLVSASLGFNDRSNHWYAALYGDNLTDALYARNIIRLDPVAGTTRFWGAPRTFGLRIGYRL